MGRKESVDTLWRLLYYWISGCLTTEYGVTPEGQYRLSRIASINSTVETTVMATHKAVQNSKPSGFDFSKTLEAIVTNYNKVVPGRRVGNKPAGPRANNAVVIFNPNGRGAHAHRMLTAAMEQFGGDGSKLTLAEIHKGLTDLGFVPSYVGEGDKRTIHVAPSKGVAAAGGVDVAGFLAKMGISK